MQQIVEQDNPYESHKERCGRCEGCGSARYSGVYVQTRWTGHNPSCKDCSNPVTVMNYPHKQNAININRNFRYIVDINTQLNAQLRAVTEQNTALSSSLAELKTQMTEIKTQFQTATDDLKTQLQATNTNLTQTRTDLSTLGQQITVLTEKIRQLIRGATRSIIKMIAGEEHPEQELLTIESE